MSGDSPINSQQVMMLRTVLNDYCTEAGIPEGHPAKDHFSRRLLSLFQSGIVQPDVLKSKMNTGYEDWLGEIGATGHFTPPKLSAADRVVGDNRLPGSDLRGRPAVANRVRI
ncbi:hypothetical protein [Mesorhizobium sp. 131-2-1]|uniref:hypothetical protein n=1 Tax=Mesorhizobium sp. 131-2-1 TaxID=2744518 RepID=UPI001928A960|nr:hypothetical protein [Mesorhizobium sp. 131-2-1]BCG92279.1 hypothetical protein MesoLj131a_11430 [Mesorhizobium sp. 131-2-1]